MSEPKIDMAKFKETTRKAIEQMATGFPKLAKELDELQAEVDKATKAGDKAKLAEAKKKRDAKRAELEKCMRGLELQKIILTPVPKVDDPKIDLKKILQPLPDFAKEMIEKKGVPLGKNGVLKPNVDFDFGKFKFNGGGATIEWKLP